MELKQGKRYKFQTHVNGFDGEPASDSREVSALFTGEYDKNNGNALLLDQNGIEWSIPVSDLTEKKKRK